MRHTIEGVRFYQSPDQFLAWLIRRLRAGAKSVTIELGTREGSEVLLVQGVETAAPELEETGELPGPTPADDQVDSSGGQ